MAKKPGERHSASSREPVTIDLENEDVTRLDDAGTGKDGAAPEASEPTPMDAGIAAVPDSESDLPDGTDSADEPGIADETADLAHTGSDPDTGFITSSEENGSDIADQTTGVDDSETPAEDTATGTAATANAEDVPTTPAPPPPHEEEPQTSAPPAATTTPHSGRSSGLGAAGAFLLGALLVVLGVGSAVWLGYVPLTAGQADGSQGEQVQSEIDALRGDVAELRDAVSSGGAGESAGLEALSDRLAALEEGASEPDGATDDQITELTSRIQRLDQQVEQIRQAVEQASSGRDEALQPLRQSVSESESRISQLQQSVSELQRGLAPLNDQVSELSSDIEDVQRIAEANRSQEKVARAIAAASLRSAVESGSSYENELQTAVTLGADGQAAETLQRHAASGIPTPAQLTAEVPDVANAMREAADPEVPSEQAGGIFEQLASGARSLVTIRQVGDPEGDGPQSAITRFENAVESGELQAALTEYEALPPEVQRAGRDFAADLRATVEVRAQLPEILSAIGQTGGEAQQADDPTADPAPSGNATDSQPTDRTSETTGTEQ